MSFSDRVHPVTVRVKQDSASDPRVLAVRDQLLVRMNHRPPDPADRIREKLAARGVDPRRITTLLAGLTPPASLEGEDVEILHLEIDNDVRGRDIFELTEELRAELNLDTGSFGVPSARSVTPNHILVSANEDHSCPFGPPWRAEAPGRITATTGDKNVVIIDSGYQWNDAWPGGNPLAAYGPVDLAQADRLDDPGGWQPGNPDTPDANLPGVLDALSGHANFIAGVIAQNCQHANIIVRNHNGAFPATGDDLPTEAGIVRSLCRCAADDPDVINLGFAFSAFADVVSYAWDIGVAFIRQAAVARNAGPTLVVAPAGNQHSPEPRYPAALNYSYASHFPEVIGVGSTTDANAHAGDAGVAELVNDIPSELRGPFSNYGEWVTCSTDGALVLSTFLRVNMTLEEDPARTTDFDNAWARWSGTSFATPKIAAEIVNAMVDQKLAPLQAWDWLLANAAGPKTSNLGYTFS
jgi:hypothetical protein